jgi:anti-sigma B factor antagonist
MSNDLTVGIRRHGRVTVVEVDGEIDIASAPQLEHVLGQALIGGAEIVIDLAAVEFMDVSGLRVLLNAQRQADGDGIPVMLVNVPSPVMRLVVLTGAGEVLRTEDVEQGTGTGF